MTDQPKGQDELLPCPHCPDSMVSVYDDDMRPGTGWRVGCGACGSHSGVGKTREQVVTLWNRRPWEVRRSTPPTTQEPTDSALLDMVEEHELVIYNDDLTGETFNVEKNVGEPLGCDTSLRTALRQAHAALHVAPPSPAAEGRRG